MREDSKDWQEARKAFDDAQREIEKGNPYMGVPDAPFKKTWHELALKRMIREAAEKGYDRLSWTPGEAHPTNPKNLGSTGPEADAANEGMKGFYDKIIPQALEKIGKEHGVKVKTENLHKVDANKAYYDFLDKMRDDLHKDLYDAAIKEGFDTAKATRFADKHTHLLEPWQLAKSLEKTAELDKMYKAKLDFDKVGHQPVHYIDVPQSMKDAAMHKGQSLFSSSYPGIALNPVDHNPFQEQVDK
jgi:hypothetical protein